MPLLARLITAPLVVEVRRGALLGLPELLADQRISTSGRVAVAVGRGVGPRVAERLRPALRSASWFTVAGGTVDAANALADEMRHASYDAVVGIGGGRVLDATKYAAARVGLPMVAVATNLAHDGIASPVSILDNVAGRGSYGVPQPIAVVVDLDEVVAAPRPLVRAGVGEVLSNLSAVADWELSSRETGEPVDGLAAAFARTAAQALLQRADVAEDEDFLIGLAEALVLSGVAMSVAGTSRPCSGACHEISHALDQLYLSRAALHGEQVGMGAVFASRLRGDDGTADRIAACLARNRLPVVPAQVGLSTDEYVAAVLAAPATRPGRYTVLEHLGLSEEQTRAAVHDHVERYAPHEGAAAG